MYVFCGYIKRACLSLVIFTEKHEKSGHFSPFFLLFIFSK